LAGLNFRHRRPERHMGLEVIGAVVIGVVLAIWFMTRIVKRGR
jgi:hypothetical protein